jgi:signal transduction histidine kinase
MAVAIAAMALLAYWDAVRESSAALGDFADEQTTLAQSLSAGEPGAIADRARAIEQPGARRVLIAAPGTDQLEFSDGQHVHQPTIERGFQSNAPWVRLSREESAALGLPARTAMVGLAKKGAYGIAVVTTARRERDREIRAQWRDVLGVLVSSALVLGFGGLALRNQRKELELARELAVAAKELERDERLVRADKLATLGAIATGIAHEVSTPLGVIAGRAEQIIPKLANDERGRNAALAILEQTQRINEVIRGFLGLARGGSPSLARMAPESCVNAARDLVLHRFEKADVTLTVDVDPDLPWIACERRLFEQVLVNLLLNACEACAAGDHVALSVASSNDRVVFQVLDDGAGITKEAAARVTEPYFKTKPEGTGLGLEISNEIVKHHNGVFAIGPREDGTGTRASVELPAVSV